LKLRFHLDDKYLEALKGEISDAKCLAMDEEGRVLVWNGSYSQDISGEAGSEPTLIILQDPIPPCQPFCHRARLREKRWLRVVAQAGRTAGPTCDTQASKEVRHTSITRSVAVKVEASNVESHTH